VIIRVQNLDWLTPQAAGIVTGWLLAEYQESNADDRAELEIRWIRRMREMVTSQALPAWEPACVGGGRLSFPKWQPMLYSVDALEEWRLQVRRLDTDVIPDLLFRFIPTIEGEAGEGS